MEEELLKLLLPLLLPLALLKHLGARIQKRPSAIVSGSEKYDRARAKLELKHAHSRSVKLRFTSSLEIKTDFLSPV